MGHRRNRESETRPRRIHATEMEWQIVREKAETAGLSISAYLVDAALARSEYTSHRIEIDAIRVLTASYQALSEISDSIAGCEPALDHLPIGDALDRVAERLDDIAAAVAAGGVGRTSGR
ncbi:hypothetical protein OCH239_13420 [Roseivivax halodurans JCM 10272]|uniref:Mobilization protein n=1 Tax=Roseivivax halodurans JCM 10272 TaxID=1449350 RepID=X7ED38_9RHOB|nr:hypothetical protein [Roseivivax halodurans]ETX13116.1 hypothetical protein OCH239_13420 [Roseivivax halodurans JCM 10272]